MGSTGRGCTVTFTGTGSSGDTISVTDEHGVTICTAIVDSAGNGTCTSKRTIPPGQHTFTPTATDAGGDTTTGPSVTVTTKPQPHKPCKPRKPSAIPTSPVRPTVSATAGQTAYGRGSGHEPVSGSCSEGCVR
ncbi:Ig-like domain-containing protein [Streptomyces sp. NPDC003710]